MSMFATGETDKIASLSPAKFDSLTKVLSLFDKSAESIKIVNSQIVQPIGKSVVSCDCTELFENDDTITIEITNPKKYVKLLKNFRNNDNIDIIDDTENHRYVITNNEIKLFMPKKAEVQSNDDLMPDLESAEMSFEIEIDKETAKQLMSLSSEVQYIEYLIQDNKLKGFHVPDTAIFLLNDYIKDERAKELNETNADLILRTGSFLSIPAEDYVVQIGKKDDESYFSFTYCNTGVTQVRVFENLEIATGGGLLI